MLCVCGKIAGQRARLECFTLWPGGPKEAREYLSFAKMRYAAASLRKYFPRQRGCDMSLVEFTPAQPSRELAAHAAFPSRHDAGRATDGNFSLRRTASSRLLVIHQAIRTVDGILQGSRVHVYEMVLQGFEVHEPTSHEPTSHEPTSLRAYEPHV